MKHKQQVSVLFVCMGNICRSPTAHGIFRQQVEEAGLSGQVRIESAGTHAYHVGEAPDARSQATALRRGVDLADLTAQKVTQEDFFDYDYILAMDRNNMSILEALKPQQATARLELMLDYGPGSIREVPDPYYGGANGFEEVFEMLDAACCSLLAEVRQSLI